MAQANEACTWLMNLDVTKKRGCEGAEYNVSSWSI